MIVCHCKGITDREIRGAVREGALSRRQVARACAAGKTCGGCSPAIDEIIASERNDEGSTTLTVLAELASVS